MLNKKDKSPKPGNNANDSKKGYNYNEKINKNLKENKLIPDATLNNDGIKSMY